MFDGQPIQKNKFVDKIKDVFYYCKMRLLYQCSDFFVGNVLHLPD